MQDARPHGEARPDRIAMRVTLTTPGSNLVTGEVLLQVGLGFLGPSVPSECITV